MGRVDLSVPSRLVALVPLCLGLVAACAPDRAVVEVEMAEGGWTANPSTVSDQEVTVHYRNVGSERHQPVAVLTDLPPGELPVEDGVVDLRGMSIGWPLSGDSWGRSASLEEIREGLEPLLQSVEPGDVFEAQGRKPGEGHPGVGEYVVLCYLPGHYERGEFGVFHITTGGS